MGKRLIITLLFALIFLAILGCRNLKNGGTFNPPTMDKNRGILVSLEKEYDNLNEFVPESFVKPIHALANSLKAIKENASILAAHGPDLDTLFRYYQRNLFQEDVFQLCYGKWDDTIFERNLRIFDSMLFSVPAESLAVFKDPNFEKE